MPTIDVDGVRLAYEVYGTGRSRSPRGVERPAAVNEALLDFLGEL
jgi:hypothetical protein